MKSQQPNAQTADAVRAFLTWAISPTGGNAAHYMQAVNFVALPQTIVQLSSKQIAKIK